MKPFIDKTTSMSVISFNLNKQRFHFYLVETHVSLRHDVSKERNE